MKKNERITLVAFDIIRCASGWLRRHLPDRFGTAEPTLDPDGASWHAPVILTYPGIVLGQVGELIIDAHTGDVISHTDIEQMKERAMKLWKRNHAKVKAAVLQTRNR
jgi:dipeptide/tripeptide permease